MKWWSELTERGPDGFSLLDMIRLVALFFAVTVIPLVAFAVGTSFIVPVERWVAVVAVLTGWPIQVRLLYVLLGMKRNLVVVAAFLGAAAAWMIGAFAVGHLLGSIPAFVVMGLASPHVVWAINRLDDSMREAEWAAADAYYQRAADARRERDAHWEAHQGRRRSPPQ